MGNSASCCEDESRGQRNLIAKNRSTINRSEIPAQMRGTGNGSSPQSQRGVNMFTNGANAPVFRRSNISASPPTTPVQARRVEEDETTIWNCGNSPRNAKVPTSSPPPLRSVEKPLYRCQHGLTRCKARLFKRSLLANLDRGGQRPATRRHRNWRMLYDVLGTVFTPAQRIFISNLHGSATSSKAATMSASF